MELKDLQVSEYWIDKFPDEYKRTVNMLTKTHYKKPSVLETIVVMLVHNGIDPTSIVELIKEMKDDQ